MSPPVPSTNIFSVDVEDWFHILDSPAVPRLKEWGQLELRAEESMEKILALLDETGTKATFFWLSWMAQRMPHMVRRCQAEGHEIASHGHAHLLAYEVTPKQFEDDLVRAKSILEDITGNPVHGYRAPGFGITEKAPWAFDLIRSLHFYDSSVFPASRGHGGMKNAPLGPYMIDTRHGQLPELPMSVLESFGRRFSLFGGGYLRLAPLWLIRWGVNRLHGAGQPLIVYTHPREIDPDHPRLPLGFSRRLKSYSNLQSTLPKLRWFCEEFHFQTAFEAAQEFVDSRTDGLLSPRLAGE